MDKHQTVLGVLFLALGLMGLIALTVVSTLLFFATTVLGAAASHEPGVPAALALLPMGFGLFICLAIAIGSVPALIAGYGLLLKRSWARAWSLIAGVLSLPSFPFGTGIGVYAIWVFVQSDARAAPEETSP